MVKFQTVGHQGHRKRAASEIPGTCGSLDRTTLAWAITGRCVTLPLGQFANLAVAWSKRDARKFRYWDTASGQS